MTTVDRFLTALVMALMFFVSLAPRLAVADEVCGELENSFGPWDYRKADPKKMKMVHDFHFSSQTEQLRAGTSSVHIGSDLDYTLRVFPNHHRALRAMSALGAKLKTERPAGARYTVECWFNRALRFAPDDPAVHLLFGIYLLQKGDSSAAIERLKTAERMNPNEMNVQYNLGLALVQTGDLDSAVQHAKKAYSLGHPLPGLRDKLKALGRSRDLAAEQ